MSKHYLVDMFGTAPQDILDVRPGPSSPTVGTFVVRLPDGIVIDNPTDASDLVTKKYAALLAYYANFTSVAYDALLDSSGLDLATVGIIGTFGGGGSVSVGPTGPVNTNMVTLGSVPSQAVLVWETFTYTDTSPASDVFTRTYVESASSDLTVTASFNNGGTSVAVLDGVPFNIAGPDQGSSLILNFSNPGASRVFLGSWALLY